MPEHDRPCRSGAAARLAPPYARSRRTRHRRLRISVPVAPVRPRPRRPARPDQRDTWSPTSTGSATYDNVTHDSASTSRRPTRGCASAPASALEGAGRGSRRLRATRPSSSSRSTRLGRLLDERHPALRPRQPRRSLHRPVRPAVTSSATTTRQSKTFFFTEIGAPNGEFYEHRPRRAERRTRLQPSYGVDTAEGGDCFPDFPQRASTTTRFYIAINEFCGANRTSPARTSTRSRSSSSCRRVERR